MTAYTWEEIQTAKGRHISIRIEGAPHRFLMNVEGLTDTEISARAHVLISEYLSVERAKLSLAREAAALARADHREQITRTAQPPAIAEALVSIFMPKRFAKAQLGDMHEIFETNVKRFGLKRARRLYRYDVARSVGPMFFHWLKRVGFIAILVDYGRKKMGL